MKTERLIDSGILNSGEIRHYQSWEAPSLPRLNREAGRLSEMYQRQRCKAPQTRRQLGALGYLIGAFKGDR